MEVAPLRLEPPAYGATIGPAGGGRGARLAAVLTALVSLLAVGCPDVVARRKLIVVMAQNSRGGLTKRHV